MSIEELFSQLSTRLLGGLMIHDQLSNYYLFLGLNGYSLEQESHYESESKSYRLVNKYYLKRYNKLIPETKIDSPRIIPSDWYKYNRFDVDNSTKRRAVENGFKEWKKWETETKSLYQDIYRELSDLNEISSADMVEELIKDVDEELELVDRRIIELKSADYDLVYILDQQ